MKTTNAPLVILVMGISSCFTQAASMAYPRMESQMSIMIRYLFTTCLVVLTSCSAMHRMHHGHDCMKEDYGCQEEMRHGCCPMCPYKDKDEMCMSMSTGDPDADFAHRIFHENHKRLSISRQYLAEGSDSQLRVMAHDVIDASERENMRLEKFAKTDHY